MAYSHSVAAFVGVAGIVVAAFSGAISLFGAVVSSPGSASRA